MLILHLPVPQKASKTEVSRTPPPESPPWLTNLNLSWQLLTTSALSFHVFRSTFLSVLLSLGECVPPLLLNHELLRATPPPSSAFSTPKISDVNHALGHYYKLLTEPRNLYNPEKPLRTVVQLPFPGQMSPPCALSDSIAVKAPALGPEAPGFKARLAYQLCDLTPVLPL